jgi:superfamily II DNA or RNA helicase/HKD family nuclease
MSQSRGLYDLLLTEGALRHLATIAPDRSAVRPLQQEEAAERLLDIFAQQLQRTLDAMHGEPPAKLISQLALINDLIREVRDRLPARSDALDPIGIPPVVLQAIHSGVSLPPTSPATGLTTPWLFTAGKDSPALLEELRREAAACEQIDILVSFITVSGVRKMRDILESITSADATGAGRTRIRVLTTTYTGATEQAALDALARLNGCEVKISLDGRRTRLHAKAWIFQRRTGFSSAYVGSANLSGAALMGGLEWTVKFTERGQRPLFERARAHFDTLWQDDEFRAYLPDDSACRQAVARALQMESGGLAGGPATYFDIEPKHYQREMLAQLERERELGRNRSLVVAATGTGKTVVAALDYRNLSIRLGFRPRLLFVAHRAQILRQALRTYREVLRDHSFGEILSGGLVPTQHDHLFATIDSLSTRGFAASLGAEFWHTVVIDECHRIAAPRFEALVTALRPQFLVGLTATPERTDGESIERFFDLRPDRGPAVELRLWDALDMQLLAPFEYYACDDDTDFSEVPWESPREAEKAIDSLIRSNEARARLVVSEWSRLSVSPRRSRAIAFCVSVEHATFMAAQLSAAGYPARVVSGDSSPVERARAIRALQDGELCALVTVDLFNEGVDLPSVDTLLLLRPTQSALLFQQQIGRGLRLSPGKESCLILDFVGQHRADFRFDQLLSSLTGLTRAQLVGAVEAGFTQLAPGCHIQLSPQSRAQILRNLRALTHQRWQRLRRELQSYVVLRGTSAVTLGDFLRDQRIAIDEVYRSSSPSGWTSLRRAANVLSEAGAEEESRLSRAFGALLHLDDPDQIAVARRVAEGRARYVATSPEESTRAQMLTYQVDARGPARAYASFTEQLEAMPECATELVQLADVLASRTTIRTAAIAGLEWAPLQLHAAYRQREILTAVGYWTSTQRPFLREGVLRLHDRRLELMFVTLDKSTGFHDRIAYHDYAISPELFHWQTQNSAGPATAAGRRYLSSETSGWQFQLFVRKTTDDAYRACGGARILDPQDITGDRPMSIRWTLNTPLPPALFREFSVLRT